MKEILKRYWVRFFFWQRRCYKGLNGTLAKSKKGGRINFIRSLWKLNSLLFNNIKNVKQSIRPRRCSTYKTRNVFLKRREAKWDGSERPRSLNIEDCRKKYMERIPNIYINKILPPGLIEKIFFRVLRE